MMRNRFRNLLLLTISLMVGLTFSEAAYRIYLRSSEADRFVSEGDLKSLGPIGFYNRSLWEFDEELGYRYAKGPIYLSSIVNGSRVSESCEVNPETNSRGNQGRIKGTWPDADVKIAVFGDSFTAAPTLEGMTWPNFFQDILEKRLGRRVNVVNFGRDGYGILQMFDAAKAKLPEWRPDIAVIAFITDDLGRARFWRTVNVIDGELRVLTTPKPTPKADPDNSYETYILHPEATQEWCRQVSKQGGLDRIAGEVLEKYIRFRRPVQALKADPLTLRHSYLFGLLWHRDPFFHIKSGSGQRFSLRLGAMAAYDKDARMVENVRYLEELAIPYILVHLPILEEMQMDTEYLLSATDEALFDNLEYLTGRKVFGLLDYVKRPVKDPVGLTVGPGNPHPNGKGMIFYAEAMTTLLIREGLAGHP